MITVTDLTKSYGPRTLFARLCFDVSDSQMVAITGPSGVGKSTLLNCLGLLDEATSGSIAVDGATITGLRPGQARRFRRDKLGYLFQNYALIDSASVETNLAVATGGSRRADATRIRAALEQVGLAGREKSPVHQLSGGEQQRVALARLIVKQPTVILADEPTGALDADNAAMVVKALRAFAHEGRTVVIATHSAAVIDACDGAVRLGSTDEDPAPARPNGSRAPQHLADHP